MLPNRIACGASKSTSTASPRPRYLPHSFQTACASASPLRAASATDRASTRGIQSNPLQNAGAHPCWISSSALLCANCAIPPSAANPLKRSRFSISDRTMSSQPHMSDFSCQTFCAFIQFSVQNQSCSHSCSKSGKDHIIQILSISPFPFCQHTGIGIILKKARHMKSF